MTAGNIVPVGAAVNPLRPISDESTLRSKMAICADKSYKSELKFENSNRAGWEIWWTADGSEAGLNRASSNGVRFRTRGSGSSMAWWSRDDLIS